MPSVLVPETATAPRPGHHQRRRRRGRRRGRSGAFPRSWSGRRRRRATRRERSSRLMAELNQGHRETRQLSVTCVSEPSACRTTGTRRPSGSGTGCRRSSTRERWLPQAGSSALQTQSDWLPASAMARCRCLCSFTRWPSATTGATTMRAAVPSGVTNGASPSPQACAPARCCLLLRVRSKVASSTRRGAVRGRLLQPSADRFVEPSVCSHHAVPFWTTTGWRASASRAARIASVA